MALGSAAAATAAAIAGGHLLWRRGTARAVACLTSGAVENGGSSQFFSREQLAGLPDAAMRYLEFALLPGQPLVRRSQIRHAGEFAMRDGAWSPFTSVEHFSVWPRGFVWDARIRAAPLLSVCVRDRFLGGEGVMYARLAGLIPLVEQRGTPEMAAGSLLRYLAEAVWVPTALLPGHGIHWRAINEESARVSLTDGPTTVFLDFTFGPEGEIVRASARRHRAVNGAMMLTPWLCHYREYQRVGGMMIPTLGEVEWILPDGPSPYWRGRTVGIEHEILSLP